MPVRPSSTGPTVALLAAALFTIATTGAATRAAAQTVQYRSPVGVEYRSQKDTGAVARAEKALAADPKNVDLIIKLGTAQDRKSVV